MSSEHQAWKDQYSIPIDTAGGAEVLVPPPDLASLIRNEDFFRVKKSRKSVGKESVVLTDSSRADLSGHFDQILDHFGGDLARVKDYVNDFGQNQKLLLEQKLITKEEYKKSLLITSSMRGKATYRAYQNYIYTKSNEKISKKSTGLRGLFYGKKSAKADTEELKDITHSPITVMKEWSKSKKESGGGSSDEVWVSSRKYEKTRNQLEKYWKNKGEVLDQESTRLLKEANIDSKSLKKAKKKISTTAPSWRQKVVLGALGVGILWGGVNTAQARASAYQAQTEIAASTEQFQMEWSQNTAEPDQAAKETETPESVSTPEKIEKVETLELLRRYYNETILPGRINHLDTLSKEDRLKVFEAIGGPENIDNGLFTVAIMGKDTTGDRYGADKDGNPLGRNDQTIVVLVDINNNQVSAVSVPRDLALPAKMYGEATPNTFNGLTWINQFHSTENGGYVPLDREVAQRVITDAVGYYVDGMVEFDFESTATLVDSLFPDGVKIEMSDTFVPENEILGKISGYRKGGYNAFQEGQTYKFKGEAIVALLRARETRKGDSYQRENDASRIVSQLMMQMVTQFAEVQSPTELADRLESLKSLMESTDSLENTGHLRGHFWGEDQKPSSVFLDLLGKVGVDGMWNTARAYQTYGDEVIPEFSYFSPSTEDMVAAPWYEHKVVFPEGVDPKDPYQQQRDPLVFWSFLRENVKSLVEN